MRESLESNLQSILNENYVDGVTRGNPNYPHYWPNDMAITAMGVRHFDPERAASDVVHSLRGQWSNGMVPHQTYDPSIPFIKSPDKRFWRPYRMIKPEQMPNDVDTSGVATLPIVAQGMWSVSQNLDKTQRQSFLQATVPKVAAFHEWFYRERDFGKNGLVTSIHPYETGMNGSPHWSEVMAKNPASKIAKVAKKLPFDLLVKTARRDKTSESGEVSLSIDAGILAVTSIFALAGTKYDNGRIKEEWPYQIEDILVNSMLVASNEDLIKAADEAGIALPGTLLESIEKHRSNFNLLHDTEDATYYSRKTSGKLLKTAGISNLAPIATDLPSQSSIDKIAQLVGDPRKYNTAYPLPTAPADSPYYNPEQEDVGAIKPAMNLLIAKGLLESGQKVLGKIVLLSLVSPRPQSFGKAYSSETGKPIDQNRDSTTAAVGLESLHILRQQT